MGYGRLNKMVQEKDTSNEKQSLPCQSGCHGPLLFIHQFMIFVLLLLLHNSGKLAIPHDHLLLLLWIIFDRQFQKVVHLVLQQCSKYCVIIGGRLKTFVDRWP